ncbi:hypothetical protein Q5752_006877 [Cryptotrichosporon argae]
MAFSAAELQRRHELEGAPDPFPTLGGAPAPSRPSSSPAPAAASGSVDTSSEDAFPSLGPSPAQPTNITKPAISAWSAKPSAVKKAGTAPGGLGRGASTANLLFTETFSLRSADLATGKAVTDTMRAVAEQTGAVVESSSQMRTGLKTFQVKAADAKRLALARKLIERGLSKPVTSGVEVPISTIGTIIGPKGATLKSITDATGCKIDIPRRDTLPAWEPKNGHAAADDDDDEDDEPQVTITVSGPSAAVADAKARILGLISHKVSQGSQTIKHIPSAHYPFIAGPRGAKARALEEELGDVKIHVPPPAVWKALERDGDDDAAPAQERDLSIKVRGDKEQVKAAVAEITRRYKELVDNLRELKISIPKRQHRFLVGAAADDILAQTECIVELTPVDDPSDQCIIRGPQAGLIPALTLVMDKANAIGVEQIDIVAAHRANSPDPFAHAKQVARFLQRSSRLRSIADANQVKVYPPVPANIASGTVVIEVVGEDRAAVAKAKDEVSQAVRAVVPSAVTVVQIDSVIHPFLIGKKGTKIAQFESAHNVATVFPPAADESHDVGLVFTGAFNPADKSAHAGVKKQVDAAAAALSALASDAADIKTETLDVDKKWHRFIIGQGGTVLNALIGEDQLVNVKVGANGNDVVVRGPSGEVDRVVAQIYQIVEDAKNDDIINGYTVEFAVDQKHVPHLVGQAGATINKLRETLGVRVKFGDDNVNKVVAKIVGRKEAVEEAKRRLEAQIEKLEDETNETVKIKREIQPALIGAGGKYAIRLEEKYGVKLSFPRDGKDQKPDEVTIRGGKKGVAAAKAELLEAAQFETENRQSLAFAVPSKAIAVIVGKAGATINAIKDDTGAQIDIDRASADDKTTITVRGDKKAIAAAKAAILAVVDDMGDETTVTLTIDPKYHRTLIGQGGQKLRDLITAAGVPSEGYKQAGLVTFPRQGDETADQVRLRGDRKVVEKLEAELERQVAVLKDTVTVAVVVPAAQHASKIGRGGSALQDLQRKTNTAVHFPGSRQYKSVGAPENADELGDADEGDIVKVVGTRDAVKAAAELLSVAPAERERRADSRAGRASPDLASRTVSIPKKLHYAIAEHPNLLRQIRSAGAFLTSPSAPKKPSAGANGDDGTADVAAKTARIDLDADAGGDNESAWEMRENYAGAEDGEADWVVRAKPHDLDRAVAYLERAREAAQAATHVGYLSGLPRSAFPRIIGSKGATISRLRADTGADITVGRDDDLITITGDEDAVIQAKDAVLAIVSRPSNRY